MAFTLIPGVALEASAQGQYKTEIVPLIPLTEVAFSPDGKRVVSAGFGTMKLWDAATGELIRTFGNTPRDVLRMVHKVAFSPDGKRLLTVSGRTIAFFDAATGKLIRTSNENEGTASIIFSPDADKYLRAGGSAGLLTLCDLATGQVIRTFDGHRDTVHSMALSPDGSYILS